MASSRESSPAAGSSLSSPAQLTPNSKVKALMAGLDSDSDKENSSKSARANLLSKLTKSVPSKPTSPRQRAESPAAFPPIAAPTEPEKDTEDEEDDEEIVRPKGRMAARMQAARESSEEESEQAGDNARERVKRLFMSKSKAPEPSAHDDDTGGSDMSDVPMVPRKRKIRTTRRETPKSSPAKEAGSPGLFVSPTRPKSASPGGNTSDSDDLPDVDRLPSDARFKALVERKRQERLAREKEAEDEKAKKLAERKRHAKILEEDEDELSDEEGRRRLTQPTRKAGKKAQEEIRRETQRMSRNQQLAHNATTKKKFSKSDFFARMGYRQDVKVEGEPTRPTSSSSAAPPSDAETKETPPTSPASPAAKIEKHAGPASLPSNVLEMKHNDDELPTPEDALSRLPSSPPAKLDKGKGKAVEEPTPEPETNYKPIVRIRQPKHAGKQSVMADDSDSDLEILSSKTPNAKSKKLDSIFNNLPAKQAKESRSLHALRMLAHLTSPGKKNFGKDKKPGMTTTELQMSLQQRARQQATREREERLQALREKGIIIQTAEEREKENAEVEDLMERARREGEEIQKREKAAAKKERKDKGEADALGDDSSDDEDWVEEKQKPDEDLSVSGSEEEEVELSGSSEDEEEDEMDVDGQEEAENAALNPLFDNEASATEDDEAEAEVSVEEEMAGDGDIDEDDEPELPVKQKQRRSRKTNIISDDEDEDRVDDKTTPVAPQTDSPVQQKSSPGAPNSVLRSATKTFIPGLTVTGPVGLGLTQIFAGTMDESQAMSSTDPNGESQQLDTQEDSMAFLKRLPAPELPDFVPTMEEDTQTQDQDMIMDSQPHIPGSQALESQTQKIQLDFSQSQVHGFDTLAESTQMSPFPATQDIGFQHMTPIRGRFVDAPPSTVETVILEPTAVPETTEETPVVKKKGKLRRRAPAVAFSDEEDAAEPEEKLVEDDEFDITADAFDVMRKASKKKAVVVDKFDKKTSKAKEMIQEQAEESEDEYAGLGGASDDESGGEEDALVKAMMDDEGGEKVDERKLAAFFADRERANDEKQVEKLYKDITNGMLRRKRGADYDLSDSDDGGEAKKRRKRAQFAKMQKALLADERIGKIAENPKRQAFLRAIEDRGSEDEMDFLDDFAEQEETTDSQSQSQGESSSQQVVPDSQPTSMGPPKRKSSEEAEPRPPPHLRRTKNGKKPTNLTEIRESLSSLIEEPNAMLAPVESGSDSEDELEIEGEPSQKENRDPFALRRTKTAVIDRISLKRASSSSLSTNTKFAFATSSSVSQFKVPPLLRRATTNNSIASSTTSSSGMSATERMAGGQQSDGVKRGGSRNSGVHYFARESERRATVVKTERRREERMVKGAEGRRKVVGGLFGGGKFE